MEMRMEMEIKEEEEYVGFVLCTYREREREREVGMCSQVTNCSAPYVLFRSGRYLPTYNDGNNDGMANTYLR